MENVTITKIEKQQTGMYAGKYRAFGYCGTLIVNGIINNPKEAQEALTEYARKILDFEKKENQEKEFKNLAESAKKVFLKEYQNTDIKTIKHERNKLRVILMDTENPEDVGKFWALDEIARNYN